MRSEFFLEELYADLNLFRNEFKTLLAYQKGFSLAMEIMEISKTFPKEEKYSLNIQIRRCSRSVYANIVETLLKKKIRKAFCQ